MVQTPLRDRTGYRWLASRNSSSGSRRAGHLETEEGRRFGYELTFFRRGIPPDQIQTRPSRWSVDQLYLAHVAITDVSEGRFHFRDRVSRSGLGKAGADANRLHVWLDQWRAEASGQSGDQQTLDARADEMALSLTLSPLKPLVIHGEQGISKKGAAAGQASHYYSFTRLKTAGTLTLGTRSYTVTGTSCMDHEFGSADLSPDLVGWDWFSMQLADNRELMVYRLRRLDGSSDPASSGTLVFPDGRTQKFVGFRYSTDAARYLDLPGQRIRARPAIGCDWIWYRRTCRAAGCWISASDGVT